MLSTMTGLPSKLDLLILEQAIAPVERALAVLSDIDTEVEAHGGTPVALGGLLVLAISQVEVAMADTIRYVLKRNPWKMEFSEIRLKRAQLLSTEFTREVLEEHAEQLVRKWSYGATDRLLSRFIQVAELPGDGLTLWSERLGALRLRRNTLLHQGPRDSGRDRPLAWADVPEVVSCVEDMTSFLSTAREELQARYSRHTRVAALRNLWSYLFDSPIMIFDDFWLMDQEGDRVIAMKSDAPIESLATSERILLGFWRAEFAGDASLLKSFSMKLLDKQRRRDLVTLIAALRDIWLY